MCDKKVRNTRLLVLVLGGSIILYSPLRTSSQDSAQDKKAGQSFAPALDWRPTHAPAGARYAGSQACAQCHTQAATQLTTPMARTLEAAKEGRILREHKRLTVKIGPDSYSITREGGGSGC